MAGKHDAKMEEIKTQSIRTADTWHFLYEPDTELTRKIRKPDIASQHQHGPQMKKSSENLRKIADIAT